VEWCSSSSSSRECSEITEATEQDQHGDAEARSNFAYLQNPPPYLRVKSLFRVLRRLRRVTQDDLECRARSERLIQRSLPR
jgi:hypothetical protein